MPPKKKTTKTTKDTDKYLKLDAAEQCRRRPDAWIGSVRPTETSEYVLNNGVITKQTLEIAPGLLRIFIEALSNAIDSSTRSRQGRRSARKQHCTEIRVTVNKGTGETSVYNNGEAIPIEKKDGEYIHTMVFGNLFASENLDDDTEEERIVSGRNGVGVACTNIYSSYFRVSGFDPKLQRQLTQEWRDNMRICDDPKVVKHEGEMGFTEVTWVPDFQRFGISGYSDDIVALFGKYTVDAAMLTGEGVQVFFNGQELNAASLQEYTQYYPTDHEDTIHFNAGSSEVVIRPNRGYEAISFVNGVCTAKGGVHVKAWTDALCKSLLTKLNQPKKPQMTAKDVKKFFTIFVRCTLPNPEFSTQTKVELTAPKVSATLPLRVQNTILRWSVIDEMKDVLKRKELQVLKKGEAKARTFKKIKGLERANLAGGKRSSECILTICEGNSAQTFAVKGMSVGIDGVVGRDFIGSYAIRGKLLNVRDASAEQILKNKEICGLIQALNLKHDVDYTVERNFRTLNYGRVVILTDQDKDGLHIAGLLLNFFHSLFPSLLEREEPYVCSMLTPLVRVQSGKKTIIFYDEKKFHNYVKKQKGKVSYKYFKGLGTHSSAEVKTCFGKKMVDFTTDEHTSEVMHKAFSDKAKDDRKRWLEAYNPEEMCVFGDDPYCSISYFLDKKLIEFSLDDCERSLPSVMDGLKQSQRKILYAAFLRNLKYSPGNKGTLKVAQFGGYVAEHSNYHHGEDNLHETTIKMAQEFPGANNIPHFYPDGAFGSRLANGKDAANARYIFTKLGRMTRLLFPAEDDVLLECVCDDGDMVEPVYYVPILPTLLINGSVGIATGWSTNVPMYNPLTLVEAVRTWLEDSTAELPELIPWYRGHHGRIEKISKGKYKSTGILEKKKNKYRITELPVGESTNKYREFLDDLLEEKEIKSYSNHSTDTTVNFEITAHSDDEWDEAEFKLTKNINETNMVAFGADGKIRKFESPHDIVSEFCPIRYDLYVKRKDYMLKDLRRELLINENKHRFLQEVMDDELVVYRRPKDEVRDDLQSREYAECPAKSNGDVEKKDQGYGYLLGMNISSFTSEKLEKLSSKIRDILGKIEHLERLTPADLWREDLDRFVEEYVEYVESLSGK